MTTHLRGNYNHSFMNKTIDQMVADFMEENEIAGLSLAIVQAPYITRAVGYGIANLKYGNAVLVGTNTMFHVAQISLGYLSVALMQAVEKGFLNLEDRIGKYLPTLKSEFQKYSLLSLMLHKTKLPDFRDNPNYHLKAKYNAEEIVHFVNELNEREDQKSVKLNPTNAFFLATAIEKASGITYQAFVKQFQIDALNLKATKFYSDLPNVPFDASLEEIGKHQTFKQNYHFINPVEVAKAYQDHDVNKPLVFDVNLKGYSDLFASASDISTWDIALAGTVLIKNPDLSRLIYEGIQTEHGLIRASGGWEQTNTPGYMDIFGSQNGYSAYLSRFTDPADLICVTLLANKENLNFAELARKIAAAYKTDLALNYDDEKYYQVESVYDAETTYQNLIAALKENQFNIFGEIDHQKNAQDHNLQMAFNKVVIFGNPGAGTKLMLDNPNIGLELPLRIQVFTDHNGRVWLSTANYLSFSNQLTDDLQILKNINQTIRKIMNQASRIYER